MRLPSLLPLSVLAALAGLAVGSETGNIEDLPTAHILTRADSLLSSGKGMDALELYDVAVDRDGSSYLNLYKRGTAHLALGQTKKALDDFEAVLQLTEFDQARLQAARIQLRFGAYVECLSSLQIYLTRNKNDPSATDLKKRVKTAESALSKAEKAKGKQNWESCVESSTEALQISSASTRLLELRASCNSKLARIEDAVGDLTRAVSLSPTNPDLLTRLSLLSSLFLNQASSSLTPLKQCLHFDPDSKSCKKLFRSLKSLDKDLSRARNFIESSSWRSALGILDPKGSESRSLISRVQDLLEEYTETFTLPGQDASDLLTTLYSWTCKSHISTSSIRLSQSFCKETHRRDPENVDGIQGVAEIALKEENYEEAFRLFSSAFEKTGRSDRALLEKVQKVQRLLKQSKAKDYYKVLGVSRDADKATIKKAYRRATKKAHPDKEGGSEAAMAAVNEAYEVLGDDGLRQRYDNGDDPNDPMSGQNQGHPGHGGNPFHGSHQQHGGGQQFFQQFFQGQGGGHAGFGGGGQQFKFHF